MNFSKLKILVIGCGSIGKRHIRNLRNIGIKHIIACDIKPERLGAVKKEYGIKTAFTNFKKACESNKKINAAFICTPSSYHIKPALFLAKRNIHLFIEKPLSNNQKRIRTLLNIVNKKKLITMMGMCYRFHPGLKTIKTILDNKKLGKIYSARIFGGHYLPNWHPDEDYRRVSYAKKSAGGGVVLTSIHGYDIIRWLFGEPKDIFSRVDKLSNLKIDVEDIALMICKTEKNILVSSYSDFLERYKEHKIDIICEKGNIHWDYDMNEVKVYKAPAKKWKIIKYRIKENDMYITEIKHFFSCLENGKPDKSIDIFDGLKTLKFALAAKQNKNYEI